MFKTTAIAATFVAGLFAATSAQAVAIAGLYNTGVDHAGVATTGNGADLHWVLNFEALAYTGGTNGVFPIGPWLAETSASRWLTPSPNAADSFDPSVDGIYRYSLNFNLTGKPATAAFAGRFAVDNTVDQILLNGAPITGSGSGFTSWTGFSSAGGSFLPGLNNITFVVRNLALVGGNPTGLRVEFTSSNVAAVPEPASWALMIAGFGLTGAAMRRRKTVAA